MQCRHIQHSLTTALSIVQECTVNMHTLYKSWYAEIGMYMELVSQWMVQYR